MDDGDMRRGTMPGFVESCMGAFREAVREMGLAVTGEDYSVVQRWLELYSHWPGRRVIGFTDPKDIARKLLADSYAVRYLGEDAVRGPVIDLGSGNGWPGLAFHPRAQVSLLDSRTGACDFMRDLVDHAGMTGVQVVEARAEDAGRQPPFGTSMGTTVARAMALPAVTIEISAPFLKPGGVALLWLGPSHRETVTAHADIREVGLTLTEVHPYSLPGGTGKRILAAYRKTGTSRPGFPRRLSDIRAKPLF